MPARPFKPEDFPAFAKAMTADPEHADLKPEEFVREPKTELMVWDDEQGSVFYFRLSRELRVDIQFRADVEKERTAEGLKEGLLWLENSVRSNFRGVVFDSVYRPLIAFAKRRMGFKSSPDLRKDI